MRFFSLTEVLLNMDYLKKVNLCVLRIKRSNVIYAMKDIDVLNPSY